jgi:hypothetical protein
MAEEPNSLQKIEQMHFLNQTNELPKTNKFFSSIFFLKESELPGKMKGWRGE